MKSRFLLKGLGISCLALLVACGGGSNPFSRDPSQPRGEPLQVAEFNRITGEYEIPAERRTIWDAIFNGGDPALQIGVNKYLWRASLETLSFLPLESADPVSGVFTTSWGIAPGARNSVRATVYIQDAALDARSLRVAAFRRAGSSSVPLSDEAIRQLEDSILTRARQLKIADE